MKNTSRFMDIIDRCQEGPVVSEAKFDLEHVSRGIQKNLKKHDIRLEKDRVVNQDDGLADRLFEAAVDFLAECGIYCTSKAGLQMMSQVMALEEAEHGIRINCICPGVVEDTELGFPMFGEEGSKEFYPRLRSLHPLGRNGKPGDIAVACLFLVSDTSGWITGVLLPVDGGRHMMMNTLEEHKTSGKEK